jgi:hypothetical protein
MSVINIPYDQKTDCIAHRLEIRQSFELCQKMGFQCDKTPAVALWDTGAGQSGISKSLAEKLSLVRVKNGKDHVIKHGSAGEYLSYFHCIDIILPGDTKITNLKVSDFEDNGKFDILLGMDIITMGDFAITNDNGKTVFSFRIPSSNKPIYFNKGQP